jgi:hypothetical protein
MILPGDKVVAFTNGTFSAIDGLTIRMKASTNEDLAADSLDSKPKNVITIGTPHGKSVTGDVVDKALAEHKPAGVPHSRLKAAEPIALSPSAPAPSSCSTSIVSLRN